MFSASKEIKGEQLFKENSGCSKVEGQGKVTLKMTFGKELILDNILHVPELARILYLSLYLARIFLSWSFFRQIYT